MRFLYACLDRGITLDGTKGASIHAAEMIRALHAEDQEVCILGKVSDAARHRGEIVEPPFDQGFRWVRHQTLRRDLRLLRSSKKVRDAARRALRTCRPEVVYERYSLFRWELIAESRAAGIPVILEVNAPLAWEEARFRGLTLSPLAQRAERRAWGSADAVVVPSRPLAALVAEAGQDEVVRIRNAVDPERFSPPSDVASPRGGLGLQGRFVVGFSGSMKAWHDVSVLVEAVSLLPDRLSPSLLLVGDGPEREPLERTARERGLHVVSTGAVPHDAVPAYIACMDVCVVPLPAATELHYFSPLKALEYLAMGRPTVVAAAGDLRDLVEAGVALPYVPGQARALAASIEQLANDGRLRGRLSSAGRSYAMEHTWRAAARTVVQQAERLTRNASRA